ncbi:hypothetical protein CEW89_16925 [Celeribacter ethanolicus]|uniref:DUF2332 domain-containing protein n=1 Tax=Celeribacter ethanolicus TaxID=1758178 RepID=A0A291GEX8_9RHOB|nr:DUF2332 family protein [Celeribacter ethanolicus]ATG49103.1 hypothetical protein CEW89_16925 [Celeribacter ethanolicus]
MTWKNAFSAQAKSCRDLGSSFTAELLDSFVTFGLPDGPIGARIAHWPGDISSNGASVPLRLAGALHGLVLEGRDTELAAFYPPHPLAEPAELHNAACAAISRHEAYIDHRLNDAPQTNEVARASALILAADALAAQTDLPIVLSELGVSAGLNLNFDRFRLVTPAGDFGPSDSPVVLTPDWRSPAPAPHGFTITERQGVDLSPRDPVAERIRLLSFIWPDQTARFHRIEAALDIAASHPPKVAKSDAVDWLAERLSEAHPGHLHLVYHTVAWQYFPAEVQTRGEAILAEAGARATTEAPLARVAMEADGQGPGAKLTLTLWPDGTTHDLGRFDFHGRWIDWSPPRF